MPVIPVVVTTCGMDSARMGACVGGHVLHSMHTAMLPNLLSVMGTAI